MNNRGRDKWICGKRSGWIRNWKHVPTRMKNGWGTLNLFHMKWILRDMLKIVCLLSLLNYSTWFFVRNFRWVADCLIKIWDVFYTKIPGFYPNYSPFQKHNPNNPTCHCNVMTYITQFKFLYYSNIMLYMSQNNKNKK